MKKIKKIMISALAAVISVAMVGCGSSNIETGENDNPRIKTLISLSKILKVSIKTLIK